MQVIDDCEHRLPTHEDGVVVRLDASGALEEPL
jgi:hypothetical protein